MIIRHSAHKGDESRPRTEKTPRHFSRRDRAQQPLALMPQNMRPRRETVLEIAQGLAAATIHDPASPTLEQIIAIHFLSDQRASWDPERDIAQLDEKKQRAHLAVEAALDALHNNPTPQNQFRFNEKEQAYNEALQSFMVQGKIHKMLTELPSADAGNYYGGAVGVLRWLSRHRALVENGGAANTYDGLVYCWLARQGYRHPENFKQQNDGNAQTYAIMAIGRWMKGIAGGKPPSAAELDQEVKCCETLVEAHKKRIAASLAAGHRPGQER